MSKRRRRSTIEEDADEVEEEHGELKWRDKIESKRKRETEETRKTRKLSRGRSKRKARKEKTRKLVWRPTKEAEVEDLGKVELADALMPSS